MPFKLQTAGAPLMALEEAHEGGSGRGALLYGGIALGILLGAAASTYLWRQRVNSLRLLKASPLQRAEDLISNCEKRIEEIEAQFDKLRADG